MPKGPYQFVTIFLSIAPPLPSPFLTMLKNCNFSDFTVNRAKYSRVTQIFEEAQFSLYSDPRTQVQVICWLIGHTARLCHFFSRAREVLGHTDSQSLYMPNFQLVFQAICWPRTHCTFCSTFFLELEKF